MIRLAVNGYGRIGRSIVRALEESILYSDLEVVAINDLSDFELLTHLTRFDSTYGPFRADVQLNGDRLSVNKREIQLFSKRDIIELPWQALGIDLVLECSGRFTSKSLASQHLMAGAKKVLVSAPVADADATVVYGVNHDSLKAEHRIVSNASCTTNCLAPIAKVLNDAIGIRHGFMTTIHAYTNDQVLLDKVNNDPYRSRGAGQSMIPTKTGAASAVGLVLPELKGRLDGMAVRVPTTDVSVVDAYFCLQRNSDREEVNQLFEQAAAGSLKNVLGYNTLPLVSVDFLRNPLSSIVDAQQTKVFEDHAKVMSWYDNEWGFANRMLETGVYMHKLGD